MQAVKVEIIQAIDQAFAFADAIENTERPWSAPGTHMATEKIASFWTWR